jgi:hypothetical protein
MQVDSANKYETLLEVV